MKVLNPILVEAARLIVNEQSKSSSILQRELELGYNEAENIMEQLEKMGVVGSKKEHGEREIYIKSEIDLEQLLHFKLLM